MKRSVLLPLAAASVAVLGLSACGGGDSSGTADDADVAVGALDSLVFDRESYSAAPGEVEIAYVNRGNIAHTLLVVDEGLKAIGPKLTVSGGGDDSGTYTLESGTYLLFCDVPGHGNMKATLTVA